MILGMLVGVVLWSQAEAPPEDARIRAVVNKLMIADRPAANAPVYSYPPLQIPGEPAPKIDPKHPQLLAYDAVKTLRDLGPKAWPFLMERLDDQRQSIPMASEIPCTVARTCLHLIADEVNPRSPGAYFHSYDFLQTGEDLRIWWAERKGQELRELRIEAARFACALGELDGKHAGHYAAVLGELGVEKLEEGAAPWRAIAATLKIPADPDALVALLAAPKAGDFLARRAVSERGSRAWSKLYDLELAAFPALAKGLEDPGVAPRCFRIMKGVLHPYGLGDMEELEIITTPAQAAAWWPSRKGSRLKELRLEAARYVRSGVQKRAFQEPGDKISLLRFIDEQIRSIGDNP